MSYQIEGAIVKEQGTTFAIVVVKHDIIQTNENKEAVNAYRNVFPGMPIILMGKDSLGKSAYYGPKEIVSFLSKVDPHRIPWRRYIIT